VRGPRRGQWRGGEGGEGGAPCSTRIASARSGARPPRPPSWGLASPSRRRRPRPGPTPVLRVPCAVCGGGSEGRQGRWRGCAVRAAISPVDGAAAAAAAARQQATAREMRGRPEMQGWRGCRDEGRGDALHGRWGEQRVARDGAWLR
jgi:hypothetical protein